MKQTWIVHHDWRGGWWAEVPGNGDLVAFSDTRQGLDAAIDEVLTQKKKVPMSRCTSECKAPTPFQTHCPNGEVGSFALSAWNGDPEMLSDLYPMLYELPVDVAGIPGEKLSDLLGTQARFIEVNGFTKPGNLMMESPVSNRGKFSKVRWSIIGSVPVDVVNMVFSGNPSVEDSVLIGFDVRLGTDLPTKPDVSMTGNVSPGHSVRYLFSWVKLPKGGFIPNSSTRRTKLLLSGSSDFATTRQATFGDNTHTLTLQVYAMCHRTFGGIRGFDLHRRGGECSDPSTFGFVERDRVWRDEMDQEKVELFRNRVRGTRGRKMGVE